VAAITGYWVMLPVTRDPLDNDFTLVFIAVRIGFEQGWSHIYSLSLQHQLFTELRPGVFFNDGQRYIAPPPLAWLTVPLTPFGAAGAFYAWTLLSLVALVTAWWLAAPGTGLRRWLWLLGAVAWYPVLYGLAFGQPALVVLLTVAAAWKLLDSGRPVPAGVVLGVGMSLKPQLVLALPLVLLAAGRWRMVAAWAVSIGILAAASLLVLGASGFDDYRSLLAEAQTLVNNRYFTTAYVVGPGALSYAAEAVVLIMAAIAAFAHRHEASDRLFALGLVASTLGATYWHLQDFTILLGAAWLFWRAEPPAWQRAWLAVVALTIELAWPLTPLPLLIAVAAWFVFLCLPRRSETARLAARPA
jgi:glycosyl transferase family 87